MLEAIVGFLGTAFLGVIGWILHLGTRVTVIETQYEGLKDLIEVKFDEVNRRLGRIEHAMNGHLREDNND